MAGATARPERDKARAASRRGPLTGPGDPPALAATHHLRPRRAGAVPGDLGGLIAHARLAAGKVHLHLDDGDLVREGLDASLVLARRPTLRPSLLGRGIATATAATSCSTPPHRHTGGRVQVTPGVRRPASEE